MSHCDLCGQEFGDQSHLCGGWKSLSNLSPLVPGDDHYQSRALQAEEREQHYIGKLREREARVKQYEAERDALKAERDALNALAVEKGGER